MELQKINADLLKEIEAAKSGKSKGLNIVPKYLEFKTVKDEFTGVFLGAAARQDVDQESGEMKTVNVCSFMDENEQIHETLSTFIFQRLQNVTAGKVVKLVYTGEKEVKNQRNAKVKLFDIYIY